MRKIATVFVLFAALLTMKVVSVYSQAEVSSTETETFSINAGNLVLVESDDGNITIESWDRNEVEVVIKKRAWGRNRRDAERILEDINIDIVRRGDNLYIRDLTENDKIIRVGDFFNLLRGQRRFGTSVSFDIKLPKQMDLDLNTDDGDIRVTNVEGDFDISVDDGDIFLFDSKVRRIKINIDDGDIRIENVSRLQQNSASSITISCDDGEIFLRDVDVESIELNVDDADIYFDDVSFKTLTADLDDGDFDADIVIQDDGRVRIWNDDGTIELRMQENIEAYFNLVAYDGRIRTNYPIEVERDEGESWVRERLGNGNIEITIETNDGDIYIRHR